MASEIAPDSFLDLLRQSGLVSDSQMLAIRGEFASDAAKSEGSRGLADELVKRGVLTQWQADMLLQGKHRGFRLGPHRILGPLGKGGMSKVFLGEHEMMHRLCAIKVLPTKYQEDPDLLGRFQREAQAIAKLDHPHIVRAYHFDKDVHYGREIYYLVMEYIEGQDLRRMVDQQGPLDYRKAADFIAQAADGLAHAHAAGFVHRDIKPANLIVDNNGVLKILDLGLARFTFEGENPWETAEGETSAVGTADYVAPEQVADSRNVDGRADIYSLGLTFYFLLTGRRPFPKTTLVDVLMAHRTEQPEPINELRPDVPFDLIDIIDRMIAKSPFQRYQTAREVADAIHSWLSESPSGREYSRISALMAAAMRAKQPSPSDAEAAKPAAETAELELAALDDEPRSPAGANAAAGSHPKPRKPPSGESGKLPAAKRPAARRQQALAAKAAGRRTFRSASRRAQPRGVRRQSVGDAAGRGSSAPAAGSSAAKTPRRGAGPSEVVLAVGGLGVAGLCRAVGLADPLERLVDGSAPRAPTAGGAGQGTRRRLHASVEGPAAASRYRSALATHRGAAAADRAGNRHRPVARGNDEVSPSTLRSPTVTTIAP